MPKIEATNKGVKAKLTAEDRRHLEYVHTQIGRFLLTWCKDKAAVAQAAESLVHGVDAVRKAMISEEAAIEVAKGA